MANGFTISRVGPGGILFTNVGGSVQWYSDVLGLTLTGRWPMGENGEMAFMRFTDDHHNIVLFTHPGFPEENRHAGYNALQHVALEVENRDEWLKALADLRRKGVEIVPGRLLHGPEWGRGPRNRCAQGCRNGERAPDPRPGRGARPGERLWG